MRLAVDAVGVKHSGGAKVLLDFLAAACADARLTEIIVLCSPRSTRDFDLPDSNKIVELEKPSAEKNRLARFWWLARQAAAEAAVVEADCFLSMNGCSVAPSHISQITFVQQSLIFCPEASKRFGMNERLTIGMIHKMTRRACRASRAVLVQTPTMKKWVCDDFNLDSGMVHVVLPNVSLLPAVERPSPQLEAMRAVPSGLRLLYVGNQGPYKNVELVAGAMSRIRQCLPGATLFLSWPEPHALSGVEGVVGCGYLRGSALREAYELADLFVMPSLVETVGLPLLEAMSLGAPVLAVDRPYAHDVCQDAAVFFDAGDMEKFALKAIELLTDDARRSRLRESGFALSEARRAAKPYRLMVDTIVKTAAGSGPHIAEPHAVREHLSAGE